MKKALWGFWALLALLLVFAHSPGRAAADQNAGKDVQIKMADGLIIKGTFYASAANSPAAGVLLLHQLNGQRSEWDALTAALAAKDYNVLAVDQRGFGKTGGTADWKLAETDAVALMGWLREQSSVNPDKVAIAGASVGSNVALRVCAADAKCATVIAFSPGLNFMGVTTEDVVSSMKDKAIFLVATQKDPYQSQTAVKTLTTDAGASVTVMTKIYANEDKHGTQMFSNADLIPTAIEWFDMYLNGSK